MKKIMALVLALILCLSLCTAAATAEGEPYELVWLRYGTVGTTDMQAGLGPVQDAANEWLAANGYNFTVNMMGIEDTNNIQLQLAAQDHIDILWRNASVLSDTLIKGNFLYNIIDEYKNYEGLYNSIPENIWNTLLRKNGTALYLIPTYKECGLSVALWCKKTDAERFGWDAFLNPDGHVWTMAELTPYLEEAMATGEYVQGFYFDGNECVNGNREYFLLDSIAAVNQYIGIDLSAEDTTTAQLVTDIPAYTDFVALMEEWNAAGYIYEGVAIQGGQTRDLSWLFNGEALVPSFVEIKNASSESNPDGNGICMVPLTNAYLNSTSPLGSGFGFASYTPHIDYCMQFMDALYGNTEFADLCLYGIEGVNYNRLEDGTVEKIKDSGYDFGTWSCANVMTVSLTSTDNPQKKELYAEFNETAGNSLLMGFVFDTEAVEAEVAACNAVVTEYQQLLEHGFMPDGGLEDYADALRGAGAEAVLAEVQAQLDVFFGK